MTNKQIGRCVIYVFLISGLIGVVAYRVGTVDAYNNICQQMGYSLARSLGDGKWDCFGTPTRTIFERLGDLHGMQAGS